VTDRTDPFSTCISISRPGYHVGITPLSNNAAPISQCQESPLRRPKYTLVPRRSNRCIFRNCLKIKTGDTQDIPSHVLIYTASLRYPPTLASRSQGVTLYFPLCPEFPPFDGCLTAESCVLLQLSNKHSLAGGKESETYMETNGVCCAVTTYRVLGASRGCRSVV
jgi:hypothetical protein